MTRTTRSLLSMGAVAAVIAVPLLLKSARDDDATGAATPPASTKEARGLPRFVELGTTTCMPCKAMLEIMAQLERAYPDTLDVQFINVREQRGAMQRFRISMIPTQIIYSPDGRELFRHVGVFPLADIVAKMDELGYPIATGGER